jgi:hypothetical protein
MANQVFSGFVYDDAGVAIASATVELFDRNTTTPVRETTTTNSSGYWTMSESVEGRYDVKASKDSWVRWIKYDDEMQVETLEAKNLHVRGSDNAFDGKIAAPAYTADRTHTFRDLTGDIVVAGNWAFATVAADGTLQSDSYNITSSAKTATGKYTMTWNTDFNNVNYSCVANTENTVRFIWVHASPAVGTAEIHIASDDTPTFTDSIFHVFAIGS